MIDALADHIKLNDRLTELDLANCRINVKNLDLLIDAIQDT